MDERKQPHFAELFSRNDTLSMAMAFSLLHGKKIQGKISSEQIKLSYLYSMLLLETEIRG